MSTKTQIAAVLVALALIGGVTYHQMAQPAPAPKAPAPVSPSQATPTPAGTIAASPAKANDDAGQYNLIDAFYAEVISDPQAFPEDIRTVTEYIRKVKEAGYPISRQKPGIAAPDDAPIMAMLRQQATPEQVAAYQTWQKATGEASIVLRYAVDRFGLSKEQRDKVGRQYNDYTRDRFGAPTVARRGTGGGTEYYLVNGAK